MAYVEYDETNLPEALRKMLDKTPTEFGEALARRHLQMIQDAVKEWAREQYPRRKRKARKPDA